jgi:hypothetical protein
VDARPHLRQHLWHDAAPTMRVQRCRAKTGIAVAWSKFRRLVAGRTLLLAHVRACYRHYGLMRQSDELRPTWACLACSGWTSPWRAVRLTFPSLRR